MKNTNYFAHDHNSRGDEKILNLRLKHGWRGFGVYWAIVEKLYESTEGSLENNPAVIAFDLKEEENFIASVINEFGLFELNKTTFSHKRVREHNEYRAKQAESGRKGALSKHYGSAMTPPQQPHGHKGKERKERKEIKESKVKVKERYNFIPPTLDEVSEYCKDRRNDVNAQRFHDFYSAKDWMIGKNKMKDWQAAIRTWERRTGLIEQKEAEYKTDPEEQEKVRVLIHETAKNIGR